MDGVRIDGDFAILHEYSVFESGFIFFEESRCALCDLVHKSITFLIVYKTVVFKIQYNYNNITLLYEKSKSPAQV